MAKNLRIKGWAAAIGELAARVGRPRSLAKCRCAFGSITCHFRSLSGAERLFIVTSLNRGLAEAPVFPVIDLLEPCHDRPLKNARAASSGWRRIWPSRARGGGGVDGHGRHRAQTKKVAFTTARRSSPMPGKQNSIASSLRRFMRRAARSVCRSCTPGVMPTAANRLRRVPFKRRSTRSPRMSWTKRASKNR